MQSACCPLDGCSGPGFRCSDASRHHGHTIRPYNAATPFNGATTNDDDDDDDDDDDCNDAANDDDYSTHLRFVIDVMPLGIVPFSALLLRSSQLHITKQPLTSTFDSGLSLFNPTLDLARESACRREHSADWR